MKNFDFFVKFIKKIWFSRQNYLFTATSGQIILFLFKSHHFRTYFLYMMRCNNISRPVHDPLRPPTTPCPKSRGRDPQPLQDWRPCLRQHHEQNRIAPVCNSNYIICTNSFIHSENVHIWSAYSLTQYTVGTQISWGD